MNHSRHFFTDLSDEARSVKPSYYFMMRSLLHSRVDTGLVSEDEGSEEDVNVYLAYLLQSFSDPGYLEEARPFLHRYDHEVIGRLSRSTDARLKYKIYKTNADFLLISVAVFDNPGQNLLGRLQSKSLEPTEEAVMGRGRTYYQFAYEYSQQLSSKRPAVTDVLEKLSRGFDRYTQILAHLRGEYLDLVQQLSSGEVYHLEREVNSSGRQDELLKCQDVFLDAYAAWRRSGSDEDRAALDAALAEVRKVNPDFMFDPDGVDEVNGGETGH